MSDESKTSKRPDPMKCECLFWAGLWSKEELMGKKKHHPKCKYREENSNKTINTTMGNTELTFGQAIEALQKGNLVTRKEWGGSGAFIFLRPGDSLKVDTIVNRVKSLPDSVKAWYGYQFFGDDGFDIEIEFTPYLCMKGVDNKIINGWTPSQSDMLSDDWEIVS